jgi:hypothetical protein
MKDREGRIVAVDFGGYSFLPHSFFVFALKYTGHSSLKQYIASILRYPRSSTVSAMVSASCALAPFSSNNVGEQISLLSFLFSAPRFLTRILSSQVFRGSSSPSCPRFSRTFSSLTFALLRVVDSLGLLRRLVLYAVSEALHYVCNVKLAIELFYSLFPIALYRRYDFESENYFPN